MKKQQPDSPPKTGRKTVLTEEFARRICQMIERFPDAEVAVTWENVITHTKRKFDHEFKRNVLSQKAWGGRRLIAEAFKEAKDVERRLVHQRAPKYASSTRGTLRRRIAELEAKVIELKSELEATLAHQYDELDVLWRQNTPLNKLLEKR